MTTPASEALNGPLALMLFGPMRLLVAGQPPPHLHSRKSLWLLALLALRQGRPVEREWVAGTLWPDADQDQAFINLRPVLSDLRRALGAEGTRLESPNRHTLRIDLAGAEVDVAEFDAAIANKTLAALTRAVTLYVGPLMEGCAEEWVPQERRTREEDCLRALGTLAKAALETGDHGTATEYSRRAVSLDPWRDGARRGLMEALARGGDVNAALQVYREFIVLLRSDPKAAPDAETSALYARLRAAVRRRSSAPTVAGAEAPAPMVVGFLPHALTNLVGREDECLEVAAKLRRSRLVTLTGSGGIGKTRLAVAVAGEVVREYADGVWLISLESLPASGGSVDEGDQAVLQKIASALGVKGRAGHSLLSDVTENLLRKRLLLVLDNCEHLIKPCARVLSHLLRQCLGIRILATSRETLRVSGETAWPVPALAVPYPDHLPPGGLALARALAGFDAVRLFVERAEAAHKAFTLTGGNARDVALLCARLEGVPLALELAAARADILAPAQIIEQLAARPLDALASRERDTAPRQRSLRATLTWSYGLLSREAQAFLANLCVFRGGWTLKAAMAVCPEADAVEMLSVLRDASLIASNTNSSDADGSRFFMLETVRYFSAEELERSGRADTVRRRHAEYYGKWTEMPDEHMHRYFTSVERDYANIRAALIWALEAGADDLLVKFCCQLAVFWTDSGRGRDGQDWLEKTVRRVSQESRDDAEESEEDGPGAAGETRFAPSIQMKLLETQMLFLNTVGDWEAAALACLRIFEGHRRSGNPLEGRTALFHASQFRARSDLNSSLVLLEECLPLERAASADGCANPVILGRLADVARWVGQSERAASFLTEALELCRSREDSDQGGYMSAMWVAGRAALAEGELAEAQERFETAVAVSRSISAHLATPSLLGLAAVARENGDLDREGVLLSEAAAAAGSEPSISHAQSLRKERAESLLARGNAAGAAVLICEALALLRSRAHSNRLYTYPLLLLLAEAQVARGTRRTDDSELHYATWGARLLGAAGGVAARLGLRAPDRAERERATRLRVSLAERLGPERLAEEEATGVALDDEAALELALAA